MKKSEGWLKEQSASITFKIAARSLARELYRGVFGREPDAAELSSGATMIRRSGAIAPLVEHLLNSSEFQKKNFDSEAPNLITAAYQGILGRSPDPKGFKAHTDRLMKSHDFASSLKAFIRSGELERSFFSKAEQSIRSKDCAALWSLQPGDVQIEATTEQFKALFDRIRAQWTKLGETEPHYSVLTNEKYKSGNFTRHEEEFYKSGQRVVSKIQGITRRAGLEINPSATVLELGCGTGRMTHALAKTYAHVIAVDVSPGNLRLCEEKLRRDGRTNVEYMLLQSPEDIERITPIDFFFSSIVLQHNPPPIIHYFLSVILGRIREEGSVFFQVPTHTPGYSFDVAKYLASPAPAMEMHCLPMPAVFSLLAKNRLRPVEVLMDGFTGRPGSHTFFAVHE